jgi:hypothetical protein
MYVKTCLKFLLTGGKIWWRLVRTPRRQSRTPRRQSRTPRRQSRTPRRQSRTPRRQSRTPRHQGRTPRHQGRTPRHQGRTPRHQGRTHRALAGAWAPDKGKRPVIVSYNYLLYTLLTMLMLLMYLDMSNGLLYLEMPSILTMQLVGVLVRYSTSTDNFCSM